MYRDMLISRVPEDGAGEGRAEPREDNSHEYDTATELFELIAKNSFIPNNESLTKSELVILYKNIDLGSRLMPNPNQHKAPTRVNQRVETIVHAGEDMDSDVSEIDDVISSQDLPPTDIYLINKERLDLLNNPPSLENTLCHKFGDLEIKLSTIGTDILFKSTTIKEQLDNLKLMSSTNDLNNTVLPSSLLDYICCKRLEENYTFYMENIIRYVKHTIDQLKRISNGDYLTEKAKEKWREITKEERVDADSNKKILAASTSIPLHVERKSTGRTITWDDIVHSEMDIRSLSKILEKKIILEVPKIICGSYKLFSKHCSDNLIISCGKKALSKKIVKKDPRVDVVLKLKRSRSGHVVSNINSIMILQTSPSLTHKPIIALPVSEKKQNVQKIIELNDETEEANKSTETDTTTEHEEISSSPTRNPFTYSECSPQEKSDTSVPLRDIYNVRCGNYNHYQEAAFVTTPDELSLSMQRLDIQSSLPEESTEDYRDSSMARKKSPSRIRIKSPYENKSHLIDEKKRKRLLEIRERREKKKMALSESCKIMKHRHGKGTLTPQASSSVTKLSITNKSFYNSIYGHSVSVDIKQKNKFRRLRTNDGEDQCNGEADVQTPIDKSKKYTNKTYYLDETETEMMYMQKKREECGLSASTSSGLTAELTANLSNMSQQFIPSVADFNDIKNTPVSPESSNYPAEVEKSETSPSPIPDDGVIGSDIDAVDKSDHDIVPTNSPTRFSSGNKHTTPNTSSLECRKSIEKLYNLLKNIGKPNPGEKNSNKVCSPGSFTADPTTFRESSDIQGSDSGTSLKHHLTCSETSTFSFHNKPNNNVSTSYEVIPQMQNRSTEVETSVVPKVIISTKCQTAKPEAEKRKKDHKRVCFMAPKVIPDNPLKAISQLLHEFDNAQKNRHKSAEERPASKSKKYESNAGGDKIVRQSLVKARSRLDQHLKTVEPMAPKVVITRDRRPPATETSRLPHEKFYEKIVNKKKMNEIIDEVKEARGEAVRGPPKSSRLNTLAQPKKSYVQAHSEEYQTKYGRNLMADRLQRLAAASPPTEKYTSFQRAKQKRMGNDAASTVSVKPAPPAPPIDSCGKARRSTSSSPASKRSPDRKHSIDCKQSIDRKQVIDRKQSIDCKPNTDRKRSPDIRQDAVKRTAPEVPETLKEKMVAVESYVKNHYGRTASVSPGELRVARKSRVPLLPCDMEASITPSPPNEESTTIGSQLHNIIDTMMKSQGPTLAPLSECVEEKNTNEVYIEDDLSKNEDRLMPFNSYHSGLFKDNIHTAVEDCQGKFEIVGSTADLNVKHDLRQYSSSIELQRLESALYRQMSIGNLQKRLRIKNLTITPKQSLQHVVVVQSGDVGSVVLKSSISQNFELKKYSYTNNMSELNKTIPILTNPDMTWRNSPIPMQISTIGYAFPQYHVSKARAKNLKSLPDQNKNENQRESSYSDNTKSNKSYLQKDYTCQTFKGQLSTQALRTTPPCSETRGTTCDDEISGLFERDDLALLSNPEKNSRKKNTRDNSTLHEKYEGINTLPDENKNNIPKMEEVKLGDIENSTSLDMLVGLLNEIQKITQAQVLNLTESSQCRQLETMLNNAATLENCAKDQPEELVTISALDRSRILDSSPSCCSFYGVNNEKLYLKDNETEMSDVIFAKDLPKNRTNYVDKEVSVDVSDRQYLNTFTNVPSRFLSFPITINTSTSISNSLVGVLSEPSDQSMFSCKDIVYVDSLAHSQNKILELDDHIDAPFISHEVINNEIITIDEMPKFNVGTLESVAEEIETIETKKSKLVEFSAAKQELDPLLKFKRDILVTVYSVLVLTVFAALSFPDLMYHTDL
ncbi:uncharacterized protein LOC128675975 [Plodia interpunctella]|uniref:uncharacterized protein LOC128675975 n=1 Tax=Plodia interpunctella TaxID=58824 RepID=UPI002368513B|nr:uncharacterized protein LOC128675975 [Plodia interpunctella]